jgi:hypothetical protein
MGWVFNATPGRFAHGKDSVPTVYYYYYYHHHRRHHHHLLAQAFFLVFLLNQR